MRVFHFKATAIALTLSCVLSPSSQASGPLPSKLEPIEVNAQGAHPLTVDTIESARKRLNERAGATGLVDGDSYRDRRVGTLADALGYAAGVFIQPRFGTEEARLSIRGSGLQRTFHGRGIELLQDGSPLNLADGGYDFQAVEPLSARYIEVYRGANALEFGAATLGGAVNFVTPTGFDTPPVDLRIEAGSFGYRREHAAFAGATGSLDGYLSLSGYQQEGFREHAEQETWRAFGNAGYRFSDSIDGRLYLTHVHTNSELPGSLTFAEYRNDARSAAPGNLALDQRRDFDLDRIGARLAWSPTDQQTLTLSMYRSDKSLFHPIFQVLKQDSIDYGFDLRWRAQGDLVGHRHVLIAGIAAAQGEIDDDRFVNVSGTAGARTNRFEQRARNRKAYIESQTWLDDRWVVSLGAQALQSRRSSRDQVITAGRDESFDVHYDGISPKLGLRYVINKEVQFFGNISRSIEPPSFGELTGGPGVTQVDKQRADTAEFGLRVDRETLSVDLALYRARVRDELLALTDAAGNPLGTTNAARSLHQGIELGLGWKLGDTLMLSSNYLFNDFRFDGDPVFGDNDLAGVPAQLLRSELRWDIGAHLFVAPSVEWAPQDYFVDHANTFEAPGYSVFNLRVGGRVDGRWSWFADARNLADRRWISSTNVIADARGLDGRNFLPGDGRSFYAGLQWRP